MGSTAWSRLTVTLCAGVLALALASCGGSSSSSSSTTEDGTTATTEQASQAGAAAFEAARKQVKELSEIQPPEELPALAETPPKNKTVAEVNCTLPTCVPEAGVAPYKELGWKRLAIPFDVTKGPTEAVRALNEAIQAGPDYIELKSAFATNIYAQGLAEATKLGIPVVQVAGESGTPDTLGCVNCDPEYVEVGRVLTNVALADAGQATGIAFVCDHNYTPLQQLNAGFSEVAEEAKDTGTQFNLVNVDLTKPPTETAQSVINFIQSNPETEYVIACIPEVATALPQALSQSGLDSKVKVLYGSPEPEQLEAVKNGEAFAAVVEEASYSHWRAADMFARQSVGEEVPPNLRTPVGWIQIITKENADEIEPSLQPPGYEEQFAKVWKEN